MRRVEALERELVGLRSERRARLRTKREVWKAVVTESGGIAPGSSGEVTIWENGEATTWRPEAWLNWMHNEQSCAEGAEVLVKFFADEDKFVIINGECA